MADALLLTELKEMENTMIMFMVGLLYRLRLYCWSLKRNHETRVVS